MEPRRPNQGTQQLDTKLDKILCSLNSSKLFYIFNALYEVKMFLFRKIGVGLAQLYHISHQYYLFLRQYLSFLIKF